MRKCQDKKKNSSELCQPMQQATGEINTNLPKDTGKILKFRGAELQETREHNPHAII